MVAPWSPYPDHLSQEADMPRRRLNARNVGGLAPRKGREQDYFYDASPGTPPGFGVKVSARGQDGEVSRSYVVAYRFAGRRRYHRLGAVNALELADARELARAALSHVAGNRDPHVVKRTAPPEALTVAAIVSRFIEAGEATKAEKTTREYRVMLKGELAGDPFGKMAAADVRLGDVRQFLETIARRAPVQANRVYQLVRAALAWAVGEELLDRNPCEGLKRPRKEKSRERWLSDAEVRVLWTALDAQEVVKGTKTRRRLVPEVVAASTRLLLLLGTRRTETLRMRWEDVDLERNEWSIPGEFRKGGEPLTVPLAGQALGILKGLKEEGSHGPVFAGDRGASIAANPGRIGAAIRAAVAKTAAKLKTTVEPFTLHDLRRTCATGCAELGAPPHVVALILGHQALPGAGRVTAVYDRSRRVREVAPWLTAWGEHVARVAAGEAAPSNVAPFRGRR